MNRPMTEAEIGAAMPVHARHASKPAPKPATNNHGRANKVRRRSKACWTIQPLPAPPRVDPLDRDIRTLADHCMELDEIAAHFGLSDDDVTASLARTTRVRRVM